MPIAHADGAPLINVINFGYTDSGLTITVNGSGFGSSLPAPTASYPNGNSGYDYDCGVMSLAFAGQDAGQADREQRERLRYR